MGFEPTRAEHIGLAVQRLNLSATVSTGRFSVFYLHLPAAQLCCESKIGKFHVVVFVQQDVLQLDVAMDQVVFLEKLDPVDNLRNKTAHFWLSQAGLPFLAKII